MTLDFSLAFLSRAGLDDRWSDYSPFFREVQGDPISQRQQALPLGADGEQISPAAAWEKVKAINIPAPIELFELRDDSNAAGNVLDRTFEQGLRQFEQQDFRGASITLRRMLAEYPDDGPAILLDERTTSLLNNPAEKFRDVWELPGK